MLFDPGAPADASWVAKAKAACGVSVLEIELDRDSGAWRIVASDRARRITAETPIEITGPARGHALMRTSADPEGTTILGTFANCSAGRTPWGTYLTCEENYHGFFRTPALDDESPARLARYAAKGGSKGVWAHADGRFDLAGEPNEFNRFGWVVEIDPLGRMGPRKRTALGRFRHENAAVTLAEDGRVVVYMGDDEQFEYVYKFISRDRYDPARPESGFDLLDHGRLHVARFEEGGVGRWIPLDFGAPGLDRAAGFVDQADVLVHARLAGDAVGATTMDRPEWLAVHPHRGEVYVTLTNNSARMESGVRGPNVANPRAKNVHGHVIRWRESGGDAAAATFDWSVFRFGGGTERRDAAAFSSPDGLFIDGRGLVWIQTDVSTGSLGRGDHRPYGNNQMLAAEPGTGVVRRFLTGPVRCEVTGACMTPDGRWLFVNIQHPGQGAPIDAPDRFSVWPDGESDRVRNGRPRCARPRSATIAICREDGGVVGA